MQYKAFLLQNNNIECPKNNNSSWNFPATSTVQNSRTSQPSSSWKPSPIAWATPSKTTSQAASLCTNKIQTRTSGNANLNSSESTSMLNEINFQKSGRACQWKSTSDRSRSPMSDLNHSQFSLYPKIRTLINHFSQDYNILRMQLQIQTFGLNQNNPPPQGHASLPSIKDLFPSPQILAPSQTLLSQLRQISLAAKAHYHYLTNLRKKAFQCWYEQDYQGQISLMEKGFLAFKQNQIENKNSKNLSKKIIARLKENCHKTKIQKHKLHEAKKFHDQGLLRKVFTEVFSMIRTRKKQEKLTQYLKIQQNAQFIHLLKQVSRQSKHLRLKSEEAEEQVNQIYNKRIFMKVFTSWQLFCKSNKLEKFLKYKALQRLIHKLIQDKKQTLKKIQTFQANQKLKQKRIILESMKETKLQSQCRDWYKYRLQKLFYLKWLEYHSFAQQQKEIEESNEIILQHFLQKKEPETQIKLQQKFFRLWKSFTQLEKEQKKETFLMKSFAELKQKQYLERKYFSVLRQNRNYEKAVRFSHKMIKQKVLEALKKNLITQSHKLENMLKFLQKRTIGKYFKKIQYFNHHYKQKITKFLLQKAWVNFTFKIASQYNQKTSKAKNYHEIALKFKSIFSLKKNVEIQRKAEFCAFYLNISMPLKRWSQRFKFRRLVYEKEFYMIKRIFFEWRIISIRKLLSKENQTATSELCVESRIDSRKRLDRQKQTKEQNNIRMHGESIVSEEISFFKKMDQESDSEDDPMTKRVDSLLTKIKTKRNENKKQLAQLQAISGFSNERLMFANDSQSRKVQSQTYEKVRLPTWSSPGNDYRVSVFSEDADG